MMRTRSGFTLIELLVVINIIGVLAAISTTSYIKVIQRARATVAATSGRFVATQLESFASDNGGRYPSAPRAMDPNPAPFSMGNSPDIQQLGAMGGFGTAPGPFLPIGNIEGGKYSIARINSMAGSVSAFTEVPNQGLTLRSIATGAAPISPGDEIIPPNASAPVVCMVNNTIFYDSDGTNYVAYGFYRRGDRTLVMSKVGTVNGEAPPRDDGPR